MFDQEDHLQRLLNRRLDGELTDDESLELDKLLIRSPELRQQLEQSQQIDSWAHQWLTEVCSDQPVEVQLPQARRGQTVLRSWMLLLPVSLAACVALVVFNSSLFTFNSPTNPSVNDQFVDQTPSDIVDGHILNHQEPQQSPLLASWNSTRTDVGPEGQNNTTSTYYSITDPKQKNKTYILEVRKNDSLVKPDDHRPHYSTDQVVLTSGRM